MKQPYVHVHNLHLVVPYKLLHLYFLSLCNKTWFTDVYNAAAPFAPAGPECSNDAHVAQKRGHNFFDMSMSVHNEFPTQYTRSMYHHPRTAQTYILMEDVGGVFMQT